VKPGPGAEEGMAAGRLGLAAPQAMTVTALVGEPRDGNEMTPPSCIC